MKVKNIYKDPKEPNDVFIGRGMNQKWGNPFIIGSDGTREEVIQKHKEWILNHPSLIADAKVELVGMNLVCYCAPKPCHGDTLKAIVEGTL